MRMRRFRLGTYDGRPAPVAQWIERCPPEAEVAGSNPAGRVTRLQGLPLRLLGQREPVVVGLREHRPVLHRAVAAGGVERLRAAAFDQLARAAAPDPPPQVASRP